MAIVLTNHSYSVPVAHPACSTCGKEMWLARIEPDHPDYDKRTFECPKCKNEEVVIVKFK